MVFVWESELTLEKGKKGKSLIVEIRDWIVLQKELGVQKILYSPKKKSVSQYPQKESSSTISASGPLKKSMHELCETVLNCTKCLLSQDRTQAVFGVGNEKAALMFIGEAPGFDEDRQGEPFVGKAGQLLTKMIEAMGLKREKVYIANIIKCRPPNNRTPKPEEIEECMPYLLEQIEKIKPKVICALGNVAIQTLLKTEQKVSKLRGMFLEWNGIKVMPTFHPAFLLRNPEYKREAWHDLQQVMNELGLKKK